MTPSFAGLQRLAGATGFRAETLEKALLLLGLLDAIRAHPYVGPRVALKGGTALNLFALGVPRLSVDIDLNYTGAAERATMETERPLVDRGLQAACERTGTTMKRIPTEHAGGKWRLSFVAAAGGTGTLALDANYMLRTPLWPTEVRSPSAFPGIPTRGMFPILEAHKLAAGQLAALLARGASGAPFDARASPSRADRRRKVAAWTTSLVADCQHLLGDVLPLRENERAFPDRVNNRGQIVPALLTDDERLRAIIAASSSSRVGKP